MEGIVNLHHDLMFFLTFILFFVLIILVRTLAHFHYSKKRTASGVIHGTFIEII
jgi:heme/copper-type cytochrome/quinol oxidase subunit 2